MMAYVELNSGGSRVSPRRWGRKHLKTQELGDENMGARRNADPQMALGGHFSLTPLIYVYLQLQGPGRRLGTPNRAFKIGPKAYH